MEIRAQRSMNFVGRFCLTLLLVMPTATLAAAHTVLRDGFAARNGARSTMFHLANGDSLAAYLQGDRICVDFPIMPGRRIDRIVEMEAALGARTLETWVAPLPGESHSIAASTPRYESTLPAGARWQDFSSTSSCSDLSSAVGKSGRPTHPGQDRRRPGP